MNLSEIVSNVKAELHPATNIDALIKRWANRAQKVFIRTANHNFSWRILAGLTLTTVADQQEYVLSPLIDMGKALYFTERTSPRKIFVTSRERFVRAYPDPTTNSSIPEIAYFSGYSPVLNQPSSASVLSVVSSGSDNAVIKIDGLNSSGILIGEEITLNGTTTVSSTNSFSRIIGRSVNGFLSGIVTITSNSGGVTVDTISPRSRQGMYPKLVFHPIPDSTYTLYYDAHTLLPDIVEDNDMSLIPEQYHDALEHYCIYRGYRHKKDTQNALEAKQAFEEVVSQAVIDDRGPPRKLIMEDDFGDMFLSEGNLPGNYPRESF